MNQKKHTVFIHSDYSAASVDMIRSALNQMKNEISLAVLPMQQRRLIKIVQDLGIPFEEYPLEYVGYGKDFNSMTNMFMPNLFIVHVAYPSAQTYYIAQYAKIRNVPLKYI